MDKLKEEFLNPKEEYSPIPFWFWNDELNENEIIRQINDFKNKGVDGFVIHPRIGIPKEIEYLSDRFMELVKCAVKEAARLNMKVVLYDEAMYPSGSAHGMVVRDNPEYSSRGLKMMEYSCRDSEEIVFKGAEGDRLISALAVKKVSNNEIDPDSIIKLNITDEKILFNPRDDDNWSILLFVETYTKGHIRGIHFGEDDGEANPPSSADLLNVKAVEKFIRITHDTYYEWLKEYFGTTVIGMFTDEPDIMGRGAMEGLKPWTGDFLDFYIEEGNSELDLPVLWFDIGNFTEIKRKKYYEAVNKKLELAYYRPVSKWCEEHNIALTGHPHESDDIGFLKYFHIPCQDIVWRWVAPEDEKAIEGQHSTMGKCSSDAARHRNIRRNGNECFACCGKNSIQWSFSADDMKWYMDWLFVRGVNLLYPHAFFYSIRGEKRIGERPPDVGPNNIWWPYYNIISKYIKRLSWLMTDSTNVTSVAVLCEGHFLPWKIVKPLYENQIEFNYLEKELIEDCRINNGQLAIANQNYKMLVIEDIGFVTSHIREKIHQFIDAGGNVVVYNPNNQSVNLGGAVEIQSIHEVVKVIDTFVDRDVTIDVGSKNLRVSHVIKEGIHFYLIVNEGEEKINGTLRLKTVGNVEKWDAWNGTIKKICLSRTGEKFIDVMLELERRESIIFAVNPDKSSELINYQVQKTVCTKRCLNEGWKVYNAPVVLNESIHLKPWNEYEGMEYFSGTLIYENSFNVDDLKDIDNIKLNLGEAGEIAKVFLNGVEIGVKMWRPYVFDITNFIQKGNNVLSIEVTNSLANKICKANIKSGLSGPVILEFYKKNQEVIIC